MPIIKRDGRRPSIPRSRPSLPECWRRGHHTYMRTLIMVTLSVAFSLALAFGCGGQATEPGDAGGSHADGSSGSSSGGSSSSSSSGASSSSSSGSGSSSGSSALPEAGTPECDMQMNANYGICVLCSDEQWHCDGPVFKQCPAGIQKGSSCAGWSAGSQCFTCPTSTTGENWICETKGTWSGPIADPSTCIQ